MENTNKIRFLGELEFISPTKLISNIPNETDDFFLILALIYNDLKAVTFLDHIRNTNYEKVNKAEISAHAGEHYGLIIFHCKQTASLINEFLLFLNKNKTVFTEPFFQRILLRMDKVQRKYWKEIQSLALSEAEPNKNSYVYTLARIRNNIGFHYDHSKQELRRGFINFFYEQEKDERNKRAYYSLGNNMQSSRFYYADAAVTSYIALRAREIKEREMLFNNFDDYANKVRSTVDSMNKTILSLMSAYLIIKKQIK